MSLDGLQKLRRGGFHPRPPKFTISAADDDTFNRWVQLPSRDRRTIEEFVADENADAGYALPPAPIGGTGVVFSRVPPSSNSTYMR
jgi:hypothetical protein